DRLCRLEAGPGRLHGRERMPVRSSLPEPEALAEKTASSKLGPYSTGGPRDVESCEILWRAAGIAGSRARLPGSDRQGAFAGAGSTGTPQCPADDRRAGVTQRYHDH